MRTLGFNFHRTFVATALAAGLTSSAFAADQRDEEIKALRALIGDLDQKLRILERKQELKEETATAAAATTPVVAAGAGGFSITSGDKKSQLRIRANLHVDGRLYLSDNIEGNDTFLIRRLRPSFEGTLAEKFGYRLMPDFAGSSFTLLDAFVSYQHGPAFNILVGKTKTPFDLERLVSQTDLLFVERAYPTSLGPNRDLGIQIHGDVLEGRLTWQAALQNGVADNASSVTDTDDDKELALRLFAHPFKNDSDSALKGLGVGVAFTHGDKRTGAPAGYRTNAQQTFFNWNSGVVNSGRHTRISPQAYYYRGPLGLIGSWVSSEQELTRTAGTTSVERTLDTTGWFLAGHWVLTGEDATYRGVTPKSSFSWKDRTWGAVELAARYGILSVDDDAFLGAGVANFANAATSAREARGLTLGVNWYLNRNVKLVANFEHTSFQGGASGAVTAESERAIFTRAQIRY